MAPVFNRNFEELHSEVDQCKPDGLGTFTHTENQAHAAHIHKQVAHTYSPALHTHTPIAQIHTSAPHTPALHPAGITAIGTFYCLYTVTLIYNVYSVCYFLFVV